jgi:hypothetical protein
MKSGTEPFGDCRMTSHLAGGDLLLRDTHVPQEAEFIDHRFVRIHIEQNGRAPAVLCQNYGLTSLANLVDELRSIRTELGDGLDVPTWL